MAKSKKSGKKAKTNKPTVKEEKLHNNKEVKEKIEEVEEVAEEVAEEIEENEEVEEMTEEVEEEDEELEGSDEDEDMNDDEDGNDEEDEEKEEDKPDVKAESKKKEKKVEKKQNKSKSTKKTGFFKSLFAKKYEGEESILTVFKDDKIYGAVLGEILGTMIIALVIFTLGMTQPLYMFFVMFAVVIAVYKLSGAQLNPINTFGMIVSRRMSIIRGVLYLLSQVIGAWLAFLIVNLFIGASNGITGSEAEFPSMAAIQDGYYWVVTFLEFLGAAVVGFFFARAQEYKKNKIAYAGAIAGGMTVAIVVVYLLSYAYFGLSGNFMLNPAVSLMYGILPASAEGLGELLGGIGLALFTYVLFPMVGGAIGFGLSDIANIFSEKN